MNYATPFPTLVANLSHDEYKALLALIVGSERVRNPHRVTKTSTELSAYLDVLNGVMVLDEFKSRFNSPFKWESLCKLDLGTVAACCYIRAFTEAGFNDLI